MTSILSRSPEYRTWCRMKTRCYNRRSAQYKNYGARGVSVCAEWRDNFDAFIGHVGRRPTAAHSIDRIDPHGHYAPGNVRWATFTEQQNNRRNNTKITFNGRTQTLAAWAREIGICGTSLAFRLKHWPVEIALTRHVNSGLKYRLSQQGKGG